MDKEWGAALLKLVERVPDWQVLSALGIVVFLIIILAVLKLDFLKKMNRKTRDGLVLFIVRYVFAGAFLVIILTFAWQFKFKAAEASAVSAGVGNAQPPQPSSPRNPPVVLPQREIDDLAVFLVNLSGRIGAPEGVKEAIDKLKTGDVGPALLILQNDILARQKTDSAKAETLRRIGLLELLRNPPYALHVYQESVELDSTSWEAWSHIGLLLERRGDHDNARRAAEKVKQLGQSRNEASALGFAHGIFGVIHHNAGQFDEAKNEFNTSRGYFLAAGSKVEFARATNNLARAHWATKDYESAIKYYREALSENTAAQNERGIAADANGLAEVSLARGEYEIALDSFKKSLVISEKLDDRRQQALTLSNMTRLYRYRDQPGDLGIAKETSLRALKLKRDNGEPLAIAYELANLGGIAFAQKNYPEAEQKYQEAIGLVKGKSDFAEALHQHAVGKVYFEWKRFASALDAFRRASELELSRKTDAAKKGAAVDQEWIATVYRELKEEQNACRAWKLAEELYLSTKENESAASVRETMAKFNCAG